MAVEVFDMGLFIGFGLGLVRYDMPCSILTFARTAPLVATNDYQAVSASVRV
jgi:hypothetical protein